MCLILRIYLMYSLRICGLLLLFVCLLPASLVSYSQQNDSQQPATPPGPTDVYQSKTVLKATTNLVAIDVVATVSKGQPVLDLKSAELTVLEDGQPQTISAFNLQRGGQGTKLELASLPQNFVTNVPQYKATTLNVVLLDALNTEYSAYAYARDELLKFLDTLPAGEPIAVYALESKLILLQDFTSDVATVKKAVSKFKPPAYAQAGLTVESGASAFTQRGKFQMREGSIPFTLSALKQLGQALAGYPGRKNLIWLSEAFPVNLFPDALAGSSSPNAIAARRANVVGLSSEQTMGQAQATATPNVASNLGRDFETELELVADGLMNAQVAVYPIDAAGVGQSDRMAAQVTMQSLAERTGGKAFINRNRMRQDIRASIDDGSTYYTVEYYPTNKRADGSFRNIAIRTSRPGVNLHYRSGYYALDSTAANQDTKRVSMDFSRAMTLDVPNATGVLFKAEVLPPSEKTQNKVLVNFLVDPRTVGFEKDTDGLQHARVSCTVWAYPEKGNNVVRSDVGTASAALKPEEFARMMGANFPCHESVALKPGHYTLRLGVMDRKTFLIGTTNSNITVQ
jgi:VWFA-related protein